MHSSRDNGRAGSEEWEYQRLRREFDALRYRFTHSEDVAERRELLRQARQIVNESSTIVHQFTKKVRNRVTARTLDHLS
jgi:hypothetical protein